MISQWIHRISDTQRDLFLAIYNPSNNKASAPISKKFTPALYREKDGVWEGGSTSQFSPVMIFKLWERFSEDSLEVSEIIEVNGRRTFGYDDPIVYKRKIFV